VIELALKKLNSCDARRTTKNKKKNVSIFTRMVASFVIAQFYCCNDDSTARLSAYKLKRARTRVLPIRHISSARSSSSRQSTKYIHKEEEGEEYKVLYA